MPFLANLRRHFSLSAPKMSVRAHVPWYWKVGLGGAFLAVVSGMIWGGFDAGRLFAGFNIGAVEKERDSLKSEVGRLTDEVSGLKKHNIELENAAKIALGAKDAMSKQVVGLQTEQTQLKEELTFFQKLTAGAVKDSGLSIQRIQATREDDGAYRVRALVVQGGTQPPEFKGQLQLTVNIQHESRRFNVVLPDEQPDLQSSLRLGLKTYQRVEGVFRVPPGAVVKSVTAKAMATGSTTARAQATVQVS